MSSLLVCDMVILFAKECNEHEQRNDSHSWKQILTDTFSESYISFRLTIYYLHNERVCFDSFWLLAFLFNTQIRRLAVPLHMEWHAYGHIGRGSTLPVQEYIYG